MSVNNLNGAHPELGEKKKTLRMKEAKTYASTIANPGPAYVVFFLFQSAIYYMIL